MAADHDPVEEMYDLLAMELLNRLKTPACPKCDTHGLTSSELTVIRQFLSDNEMKRVIRSRAGPQSIGRTLPFEPPDSDTPVQRTA